MKRSGRIVSARRPIKREKTQYTLRGVPPEVDRALRERATREGRSLNVVAIEAIERGLALNATRKRHNDLSDLAGTWVEDPAFDEAIALQDQVFPEDWKAE